LRERDQIAQRIAGDKTSRAEDYAAGSARVLYVQPDHDPLARVEEANEYKRALDDRVTVVGIPHSSHAVVVEQPAAVSDALNAEYTELGQAILCLDDGYFTNAQVVFGVQGLIGGKSGTWVLDFPTGETYFHNSGFVFAFLDIVNASP